MKAYPEYRDSGVEWLGRVPAHWEVKRLRTVAKLNPSATEVADNDPDLEVSFVPMETVGEAGELRLTQVRRLEDVTSGYTYFRDGDVTFAKITPCFENGKGALMQGLVGGFGFGSTELTVIRAKEDSATPEFVFWLTASASFRMLGEAQMYGAGGQKRVPDNFARNFEIAFPSLAEQRAITAFLDRETAKIDALIEEQRRLIDLLAEKRRAVIARAVTKGLDPDAPMKPSGVEWLGEVPTHWEVRKIASVSTKITNGYVGPTRDILAETGVRYLQSLHIKNNKILFKRPYFVSAEWSLKHSKSILKKGDVLIVQTGDIGQVAVVSQAFEGANCHALIIVSPEERVVSGEWISWVLSSDYGLHSLLSIQTGALHPHLNCGNVKFVWLPIPPLAEQLEVMEVMATELTQLDAASAECSQMIDLLIERRAALITAAVTGKIDVRDAVPQTTEAA